MSALDDLMDLAMWLAPQGGQEQARRNAWRSMVEDHARVRARREAGAAIAAAQAAADLVERAPAR